MRSLRREGLSHREVIASLMAIGFSGSAYSAPSPLISGSEDTGEVIAGTRERIASRGGTPKPSKTDKYISAKAPAIRRANSSRG
jgi:hypothetical protein